MRRIYQINNSIEKRDEKKKQDKIACVRVFVYVCTVQFAVSASRQFITKTKTKRNNRKKSIHGVTVLHAWLSLYCGVNVWCVCMYALFAGPFCFDAIGLSLSLAFVKFFAVQCFMRFYSAFRSIHPCCECWCYCYCYCYFYFFLLSIILMVFWPPTFTAHRGRKTLKRGESHRIRL